MKSNKNPGGELWSLHVLWQTKFNKQNRRIELMTIEINNLKKLLEEKENSIKAQCIVIKEYMEEINNLRPLLKLK